MINPVAFHVGSREIYWYGILVATGFLLSIIHLALWGRREGRHPATASDVTFWIMLASIVGARAAYVTANFSDYTANPWLILRVDHGGLIFYGGLMGACLATVLYARIKQEPLWAFADYIITALPLGHALGRVGCFLKGCCHGAPAELPWSVSYDGIPLHPVQLYEAAFNLIIYGLLLMAYRRKKKDGAVFALYLILYSISRFALEFFRGDPRQALFFQLNTAQGLSLALLVAGVILTIVLPSRAPVTARTDRP